MIKQRLREFYEDANRNEYGGKVVSVNKLKLSLKDFFGVTDRTIESYLRESAKLGFITMHGAGCRIIDLKEEKKQMSSRVSPQEKAKKIFDWH